jgi:DNA-binding PadR family transcriptional regulator
MRCVPPGAQSHRLDLGAPAHASLTILDAVLYTQYATRHDIACGDIMSIRHALLALLTEGPKYGLQLREEFEARTGEVWPLNVGQVYTTLQRLERDGLVESDDDADPGPQKGFRITADGAEELAGWLRTPPDLASPPRDELVIKILIAVRLPGVDVHEVIQSHRRYMVELMQQWTRLKEAEGDLDLGLALVVDAELYRLDSVVQWLDTADGRLKRAALEPPAPSGAPVPRIRRRAGVRR